MSKQLFNRFIIISVIFSGVIIGFASAGSSVGSNPGYGSLPTSFEWEGDKLLNGEDAGSMFENTESKASKILDEAEAAGMVLYSTGASVNNSTSSNQTVTNQTNTTEINDILSGYASVGDIIKAKDWAALDRYTTGIQANKEIEDSSLSLENRNNNWEALFTEPQVVSCGPC